MVIIYCGEMVKSRETVGVSVKLKKRDGWSWVGYIRTVKNLSVCGFFFFFVFFSAGESVSVFLSEVLDTDGCGCIAVKVNEV